MDKPTVAIFGATGGQGAAVARALAKCRHEYLSIRGLTRDINSAHAQQLREDGVDLIPIEPYDYDSIHSALVGVHAVFVNTVTDYNDPNCLENEKAQGRIIADACVENKVGHVIYSSQLHTTRISGSLVRHMVAKAEIEDYMRDRGLNLTCLIMPIYYEDFLGMFKPMMSQDGCFHLFIPTGTTPLDMISVADIGPLVAQVIRRREKSFGKTISPIGDKLTMGEVAFVLSKHLPHKAFRDRQLTVSQFAALDFIPGVRDWAQMFQFLVRQDQPHKRDPSLQSFEEWVINNRADIDKAMGYNQRKI